MSGVAHAVGLAVGDDDGGVVQQAVQDAGGGGVLGQEPAPLVECPVGGDRQGAALVGGRDEPEQSLGAGVVQRCEANFCRLCGYPHSWTYADTATMPRGVAAGAVRRGGVAFASQMASA